MENGFEKRLKLIKDIHQNHKWFYVISSWLLIFIIGILIGGRVYSAESGYWVNLFTDGLGIVLSVGLIGSITKLEADRSLRRSLIVKMRSTDNATALNAVAELRERGWTNLQNEELGPANLQSADLSGFNLHSCDLTAANLRNTILVETDLRRAILLKADMSHAILQFEKKLWTIEDIKNAFGMTTEEELSEYLSRKVTTQAGIKGCPMSA